MFEIVDSSRGKYLPARSFAGDAGLDLSYSSDTEWGKSIYLDPGDRWLFGTNLRLAAGAIDGGVGLICPRSGLAHKHGISIVNSPGVLDAGYRGEIKVNLINLDTETVLIEEGMRIAQLVCVPLMALGGFDSENVRGSGGHGSSGR